MEKTFGAFVRQLRVAQGYSLRAFAREIGVSGNFLSEMERGRFAPPSEGKIVLIAEKLGRNTDEMLALAGKVSSDVIEIILQRPKELTTLLRRFQHAPAAKVSAYTSALASAPALDFYPLETVSHENHTAVIGESGSGKSLLTKYLIYSYFQNADVRVYDSDTAPADWGGLEVIGRKGDYAAIARCMAEDVEELQRRTSLHGEGYDCGGEVVRVIEEYPSTAAELAERPEIQSMCKDIGLLWLRRLLRRGRKYRMKVFAVAQEFEVNAWKIAGEGGLRRAFTVLYVGSTAYQALLLIKDKPYRERLRVYFDGVPYPCLVDVKGRLFPAEISDLSGFAEIEDGAITAHAAFRINDSSNSQAYADDGQRR
jgi:HTH-type transcriptional regulator, competence development regulator